MAQSYIDTLLYALERPNKQTLYFQNLDDVRVTVVNEAVAKGHPFKHKGDFINMPFDELERKAQSRGLRLRLFNKSKDAIDAGGDPPKKAKKSKGQKKASRAAADVMAMEQAFHQRVKDAIADLWADDGDNYDEQYQRGLFEMGAKLTDKWDEWVSSYVEREDIKNWLLGRETIELTPKFPRAVLEEVSAFLLQAEDRLSDLREYNLVEDKFGVLDVETDVQTLAAKVQGILDAEEAHVEDEQD